MPEETDQVLTDQEEGDKLGDDSTLVRDDQPTDDLPTDPEQLKEVLRLERREFRRLAKENERLQTAKIQAETSKQYWYEESGKKDEELERLRSASPQTRESEQDRKSSTDSTKRSRSAKADLSEYVAEDDGAVKLVEDFGLVTADNLEKIIEQKAAQIVDQKVMSIASRQTALTRIDETYGNDPKLEAETKKQYTALQRENPNLDDATAIELAGHRAATALGISPKKSSAMKDVKDIDRERRLRGQEGDLGTKRNGSSPVVVTQQDRRMANLIFGENVSDNVIVKSKRALEQGRSQPQTS
jgi:hypothetical protein